MELDAGNLQRELYVSKRPIIVAMMDRDEVDNSNAAAFSIYAKNKHGATTVSLPHDECFDELSATLKRLIDQGFVPFILIEQNSSMHDYYEKVIGIIRGKISNEATILLIPNGRAEQEIAPLDDPNLIIAWWNGVSEIVDNIMSEYRQDAGFFGCSNLTQVEETLHDLAKSYQAMIPEGELPEVADEFTQQVLQALRLRSLPAEQLASTFEESIGYPSLNTERAVDTQKAEMDIVRNYSETEREELFDEFMRLSGSIPDDGGYINPGHSKGENIRGVSVDTATGDIIISKARGEHNLVRILAENRIRAMGTVLSQTEMNERIVTGSVYSHVKDFQSNFVSLNIDPGNDSILAARYLVKQGFIVVDSEGCLIE